MTPVPNYIIADTAYHLTPFCIKELDRCSSNNEAAFNNLLCIARNPVEYAFEKLKSRWSILARIMDLKAIKLIRRTYSKNE